jgi:hypothetical protein
MILLKICCSVHVDIEADILPKNKLPASRILYDRAIRSATRSRYSSRMLQHAPNYLHLSGFQAILIGNLG